MNRIRESFMQGLRGLSRFNVILLIVLVIQLILTVVVSLPRTSAVEQSQGPLLKNFDPATVTGLTIHDKNNASQLTFTKDVSGNWVIPTADKYPISGSQVTTLLNKIKALDTNRLIAQNASSQNRLEVANDTYERLVELKQGDKVDKLYVGSSQGASASNTRLNDQSQIYLTSGLSSTDVSTSLSSWFDTPYFTANEGDITQLTVANAQGTFTFNKTASTWAWTGLGKGQQLNSDRVSSLVSQVSSVQIATPLGKTEQDKYGMKTPLAVITLTTQQTITLTPVPTNSLKLVPNVTPTQVAIAPTKIVESTSTLTIGAKLDSGNYALKSSGSQYYVEISTSLAEAFTKLQGSDLVTASATSAATQSAATPTATPPATSAATDSATDPATP